ncbi:MAG: DNA polymerase III subunit delta [Xenococcaceae cyanobacterium]
MPAYLFWGEDDFALSQAVAKLKAKILDPNWLEFNYHQLSGDRPENIRTGLNQTMTPVFGIGGRLVWLKDTTIFQQCSPELLGELERTLPVIPDNSHLLFTSAKKPDRRLKSTKLAKKFIHEQEFSLIPPWQTEKIQNRVHQFAREMGLKFTPKAIELLAESVGNDTRQLWNELTKLSIYSHQTIDRDLVASLVVCNTQNSLQLAEALREGKGEKTLVLITELLARNEPPLKIVATLIGQFRTWTMVKLMEEAGENEKKAIAQVAEVSNPYRIDHLRRELKYLRSDRLLASLPILLELEYSLKKGAEPISTLQTQLLKVCQLFSRS